MTDCTKRLNDGPLVCLRTDPHHSGHVYAATAGADLDNSAAPKYHVTGDDQ